MRFSACSLFENIIVREGLVYRCSWMVERRREEKGKGRYLEISVIV